MNEEVRFLNPSVLASISNLELRAKIVVEGFLSGLHRSPHRGFSVEFAEYRHYHRGDDMRYIDWKKFARTDKYYIKQYEDETNVRCYILMDCSASMGYRSGEITKLEFARTLASALAYFMMGQRDAVGLITFDDKIMEYLPCRYRHGHLMQILQALARATLGGQTDVGRSVADIALTFSRKSLVILISDLLDEENATLKSLQQLRFKGNDVIVFHVMDPAELTFPFERITRFEDAEGGEPLTTAPREVRKGYLQELEKFLSFYRHSCPANGIDYCLLNIAEPLDTALAAYLSKRAKSF